ncbi:protein FrlC [Neobacillus sp. B4I6]|uniref:TIM barrel protein n=1 Tax=Bacillaceae TaxID=186817 RepID=UPI001BE938BE|nr:MULTISPECIES: TIM barrel protein [unclassified Bacillus (in: firmicutes)]MBT2700764.1 TIM barrel protein [Bacillus sp. ISL-40]MBT2726173.1 TIM barrel protein [Bacillus sp. ISL-75]MBT2743581.1 TIM barrel protein [Bacillus sp. ISL-77]
MGKIKRSQITGMNFHYLHYPLDYFLDAMVKYEFEKIELWGAAPHLYVEDLSLTAIRAIKKEIARRDLEVVCFTPEQCMYPINLAAKESAIRERSVAYFKKSIDAALELEAPMVLVTAGWGYRNESRREAWSRTQDSLEQLTAYAEKQGTVLALEPLQKIESNLINTLPDLKEMLDSIHSPALKGMVDTIPLAVEGEALASYFEELREDFVHIHFIDGDPGGHLAWGDGSLPLEKYMKTLGDHNYNRALTLEFTSSQYLIDPNQAVEKSLRSLAPFLV